MSVFSLFLLLKIFVLSRTCPATLKIRPWTALGSFDTKTIEALEIEAHYSVYLERQSEDAAMMRKEERRVIPDNANFADVPGLSNEMRQKLLERKPSSIAEAQRIDGMTPAALALIVMEVRRMEASGRGAA